jgi:chromosome segregation ATPase
VVKPTELIYQKKTTTLLMKKNTSIMVKPKNTNCIAIITRKGNNFECGNFAKKNGFCGSHQHHIVRHVQGIVEKYDAAVSNLPSSQLVTKEAEVNTLQRQINVADQSLRRETDSCAQSKQTMKAHMVLEIQTLQQASEKAELALSNSNAKLSSDLSALRQQLTALTADSTVMKTSEAKYQQDSSQMLKRIRQCTDTSKDCAAQLSILQDEKRQVEITMAQHIEVSKEELKKQVENLAMKESELQTRISQAERLEASIQMVQKKYEADMVTQEKALDQCKGDLSTERLTLQNMSVELTSLRKEYTQLQSNQSTIQAAYKVDMERTTQDGKQRDALLTESFETQRKSTEQANEDRVNTLTNVLQKLKSDYTTAKGERDEKYRDVMQTTTALDQKTTALENARQSLTFNTDASAADKVKMNTQLAKLKQDLRTEMERAMKAETNSKHNGKTIIMLKQQVKRLEVDLEKRQNTYVTTQKELEQTYRAQLQISQKQGDKRLTDLNAEFKHKEEVLNNSVTERDLLITKKTSQYNNAMQSYQGKETEFMARLKSMEDTMMSKETEFNKITASLRADMEVKRSELEFEVQNLATAHNEISELKTQIDTTNKQMEATVRSYESQMQVKAKEFLTMREERDRLKDQTVNLDANLLSKVNQLKTATEELEAKRTEVSRLLAREEEFRRTDELLNTTRDELTQRTSQKKKFEEDYDIAVNNLKQAERKFIGKQTELDQVSTQLVSVTKSKEELTATNSRTQEAYHQCKSVETKLRTELQSTTNTNERMQVTLNQAQSQGQTTATDLKTTRTQLAALKSVEMDLKNRVSQLESEMKRSEQVCTSEKNQCETTRKQEQSNHDKEMSTLAKESETHLQSARNAQNSIADLTTKQSDINAKAAVDLMKAQQDRTHTMNILENLKKDITAVTAEKKQLEDSHVVAMRNLGVKLLEVEKRKGELMAEQQNLQSKCDKSVSELETKGSQCYLSLEEHQRKLEEKEGQLRDVESARMALTSQIDTNSNKCRQNLSKAAMLFKDQITRVTQGLSGTDKLLAIKSMSKAADQVYDIQQ